MFKNSARLLGFLKAVSDAWKKPATCGSLSGIAQISIAMGAPVGVIKSILNPALKNEALATPFQPGDWQLKTFYVWALPDSALLYGP